MKTGACKFGATCKFHHPRDIQLSSPKQESGSAENPGSANNEMTEDVNLIKPLSVPALLHNSKGLPIRPVLHIFYRLSSLSKNVLHASFLFCLPFGLSFSFLRSFCAVIG